MGLELESLIVVARLASWFAIRAVLLFDRLIRREAIRGGRLGLYSLPTGRRSLKKHAGLFTVYSLFGY